MEPKGKVRQRVTLDTGCSEFPELRQAIENSGAEIMIATTTAGERGKGSSSAFFDGLERKTGPGGWGLNWGECWGGGIEVDYTDHTGARVHGNPFIEILRVVSSGGVKLPDDWSTLTRKQAHVINDAMIFSVHVQHCGGVFVTVDRRAFVNEGRRVKLETMYGTRILTAAEAMVEFAGLTTAEAETRYGAQALARKKGRGSGPGSPLNG